MKTIYILVCFIILNLNARFAFAEEKNNEPASFDTYKLIYELIMKDTSSIMYLNERGNGAYEIYVADSLAPLNTKNLTYISNNCNINLETILHLSITDSIEKYNNYFLSSNCLQLSKKEINFKFSKVPTIKKDKEVFAILFSNECKGYVEATLVYISLAMIYPPTDIKFLKSLEDSFGYNHYINFVFLRKNDCVYKIFSSRFMAN